MAFMLSTPSFSQDLSLTYYDINENAIVTNTIEYDMRKELGLTDSRNTSLSELLHFLNSSVDNPISNQDKIDRIQGYLSMGELNPFQIRERESELLSLYDKYINKAKEIINRMNDSSDNITYEQIIKRGNITINNYDFEKQEIGMYEPFCDGHSGRYSIFDGSFNVAFPICKGSYFSFPSKIAEDFFYGNKDYIIVEKYTFKNTKNINCIFKDNEVSNLICLNYDIDNISLKLFKNTGDYYEPNLELVYEAPIHLFLK